MIVSDLNNDSKLDLVVVNRIGDDVSVILSNGDGTFQNQMNDSIAYSPICVITDDFNNDFKLDLAVSNGDGDSISVLLGNRAETGLSRNTWRILFCLIHGFDGG